MSVPVSTILSQSDTTAPVLEFRCLYTFNLTQKKKKWQDGTLKFHTRNKRAMVFDESYNHIGDGHWNNNSDPVEGDEFDLHCGALVQVADMIRTSHSDLTPILERKRKHAEELAKHNSIAPVSILSQRAILGDEANKKHKSLRSIIASQSVTSRQGPRYSDNVENEVPNGRSKLTTIQVASIWSVTATTKKPALKPRVAPMKAPASKAGKSQSKSTKANGRNSKSTSITPGQSTFKVKQVIDLTSDPVQEGSPAQLEVVTTPRADKRSLGVRRRHVPEQPAPIVRPPSSPPVTSANLVQNVDVLLNQQAVTADTRQPESEIRVLKQQAKPLRLSKTKAKGALLCMQNPTIQNIPNQDHQDFQDLSSDSDEALMLINQQNRFMQNPKTVGLARDQDALDHNDRLINVRSGRPPGISKVLNTKSPTKRQSQPRVQPQGANINTNSPQHNDTYIPSSILLPTSSPTISTSPRRSTNSLRRTQSAAIPRGLLCDLPHQNTNSPVQSPTLQDPKRRQFPQLRRAYTLTSMNHPSAAPLAAAPAQVIPPPATTTNLPLARHMPPKRAGETGPWSVEALDLFDWRPPDWEQRRMDVPGSVMMVD